MGEDIELVLSPQTGRMTVAGRKFDDSDVDMDVAPVARVLTEGRAEVRDGDPVTFLPSLASVRAGASLDDARRMDLLSSAWHSRDTDALVAQGEADAPSALAAFTLASWIGRQGGDPRSALWLQRAVMTGNCPTEDILLTGHVGELTFSAAFEQWGLDETLGLNREALAVVVASDLVRDGDLDGAYGILLDAEQTPRVSALRSLAATELGWWPRALDAAALVPPGRWSSVAALARGTAHAHLGHEDVALKTFDGALAEHAEDSRGGDVVRAHLLIARSRLRVNGSAVATAWDDVTQVLRDLPQFPGAAAALKAL